MMRVLQVLHSISSRSGGPVRSTLASCQAIRTVDSGMSFTLTATDRNLDPAWHVEFRRRMRGEVELQLFPAVGHGPLLFSFSMMRWLWRKVPDYDLVVVRALLHPISTLVARIARRHDVPYLVVPHGTLSQYTFEHRRTWLKRLYFRFFERSTLRGATAVRFTSESERDQAPPWCGNTPVRIIPHPFVSQFSTPGRMGSYSQRVLYLSRFHPGKGLGLLLRAFSRVQDRVPDSRLMLAGAGSDQFEGFVRGEIRRLGLNGTVVLPGFVEGDEKTRLLSDSSVFVLPSRQESFGVSVVEAMDAGLPVVISHGVGIWREVKEAGAGLVVDREPGALADALTSLLLDPERGFRMGKNGQKLVKRRFDPEYIGHQLRSLYRVSAGREEG